MVQIRDEGIGAKDNPKSRTMKDKPQIGRLGQWLNSWVQSDGAIHGFHNHPVWGDNPFRYLDFTAGHSTFASPFLLGLALALKQQPNARGKNLLGRLARFQANSFQKDGQFAHIGFQVGETLKAGLIHNVVPCVVLSALEPSEISDSAVRKVLASCDRIYGAGATEYSVANQEYCRLWARLLHMQTYGHKEWHDSVAAGLDFLIERFHVRGHPDGECVGTWRVLSDLSGLEPAEYYGLMIHPLLLAYERYGKKQYLDEASAMARHCARSSWVDGRGQRRAHRLWTQATGAWQVLRQPMLIGGYGITLSAIQALVRAQRDEELENFLQAMDATYVHYQSGAGFFLAATGWGSEQDIIPSTAWQSHDFFHLIARHGPDQNFWDNLFGTDSATAVVFGQSMVWIEDQSHWAVRGYHWTNGLNLVGRKDRLNFYVDIASWIQSKREAPAAYLMPDEPKFLRGSDAIYHIGGRSRLHVLGVDAIPFRGQKTK